MTKEPSRKPRPRASWERKWRADSIGAVALNLLAQHSNGVILAVFERSIYVHLLPDAGCEHRHRTCSSAEGMGYDADNALICISERNLGAGPLQICVSDRPSSRFTPRAWLQAGARVAVDRVHLSMFNSRTGDDAALVECAVIHANAPLFLAAPGASEDPDPRRALRCLAQSGRFATGVAPGLQSKWVRARSASPLRVLQRWLAADKARAGSCGAKASTSALSGAVYGLIGLGQGLTPAADDYLAGVLVGLRYCRRNAAADELSYVVQIHAKQRTNRISRAHLACVRAGRYQEIVIDLLAAIDHDPQRIDRELTRLSGFGHSSGMDLLAGFAAALESCD